MRVMSKLNNRRVGRAQDYQKSGGSVGLGRLKSVQPNGFDQIAKCNVLREFIEAFQRFGLIALGTLE